jgi:predicted O-methyltransferase YrrM
MEALVLEALGGRPLRILEVGSWAGGSAITWAAAISKQNAGRGVVVCVDSWKPFFDPAEMGAAPVYREMAAALATGRILDLFRHNVRAAGFEDTVVPVIGASQDVLPLLGQSSFDLVFIDADHRYSRAGRDLALAAPLVAENGILCGDDLELQLDEVDRGFTRAECQRDFVPDPRTGQDYHPGVTLAVGELLGRVSGWEGFWAVRKLRGWEPIELTPRQRRIPRHLVPVDDYRRFARKLGREGRLEEAVAVLEHALRIEDGDLAPVLRALADLSLQRGDLPGATAYLRRAEDADSPR